MVINSPQSNIPDAPVGEISPSERGSMPLGFTFALQTLRVGHGTMRPGETRNLKPVAFDPYNDASRSRTKWGNYRV